MRYQFSKEIYLKEALIKTAYGVRINVSQRTRNVRELILARAFSSTVIEENAVEPPPEIELDINDVLTDWFEKYDSDKA